MDATSVARAIVAALDWNSSPDARKVAVSYLESVKAGDVRTLASTSFQLVKKEWSSEIRMHAFKMLQHVVRLRWDELSPTERRDFANAAVDLMREIADTCAEWALKSQTAALIAEIVRREGLTLWQELLPSVISLSNSGPIHAELVSMMLRWLPEDITVHNEDLEGDRRRLLLRGLTQSLPEILSLLYTLLERHFGVAIAEAGRQQLDIAKQHAATVVATLHAINAYSEWAPMPDLLKYGIINGCGFLLSSPDFRLHACEFFKLVSSRKRHADAASDFDSAMSSIFHILMNVSADFLSRSNSSGITDEWEIEFAEYICESMVSLGSTNLQCISGDDATLCLFFQQMLGYFKHYKLALHYHSLMFWLVLMRDLCSKTKTSVGDSSVNFLSSGSGPADNLNKTTLLLLNDENVSIILDVCFQRLLRKEKAHPGKGLSAGSLELWSDDFEGKGDFGQYRAKLLELIRFVSSKKPLVAATKVSETIKNLLHAATLAQEIPLMESMQVALENIVAAILDGSNENDKNSSEIRLASCGVFEGLLQQLVSLKFTEPENLQMLGQYLVALGPFLKFSPDSVGSVINKLFELLTSLPLVVQDPSTSAARHARLQICTSFIRLAKAADKSLLPHMKGIADAISCLQKEGRVLRGEHNLLGEAFLIMASAAGVQQQQDVLTWLLEPMSKQWTQIAWQDAYLSDPTGLVKLCADTKFMWSIFHTVTFFEKALKRSGVRKGNLNSHPSAVGSTPSHPLASHLSWMLPPLLKLLRAIHSLWSPPVIQTLPGEIKAAMIISDIERTSLLGESNPKLSKGAILSSDSSLFDMNKEGYVEPNETDIRNWLKGVRDSGYNVLGLSATVGDSFFRCLDVQLVALALIENLQSMEFRHMRQLVHSVLIPIIRRCPSNLWEIWLENLLHPLLLHSQQSLSHSWSGLLEEGRAKVPDFHGIMIESDLKVEVMEEKLLRGLTREICSVLSVLGSSELNSGLPAEQPGFRGDISSLKDLDTFASSSIVGFLVKNKTLALPALQMCLDAFRWTDSEALTKICSFCGAIVLLAISANNVELQEFVCRDMFSSIIQALALELNAIISADLIGLCREIYINFCSRDPVPRQILLSLPCIKHEDVLAFEEALGKTSSPKEQKQHMRSFLLTATGNKLKALVAKKSVNVITNVSARPVNSIPAPESRTEDLIGLAAIM